MFLHTLDFRSFRCWSTCYGTVHPQQQTTSIYCIFFSQTLVPCTHIPTPCGCPILARVFNMCPHFWPQNWAGYVPLPAVTLLQKGKSCHQVTSQVTVNHSTVTELYCNVSSTASRQHGGYKTRFTFKDWLPLAGKSCLEQSVMPLNSREFCTWISSFKWSKLCPKRKGSSQLMRRNHPSVWVASMESTLEHQC